MAGPPISARRAADAHAAARRQRCMLGSSSNCPRLGSSAIAEAMRYGLNHWEGLCRFLDDGRIEIDTNTVERSIRRSPWKQECTLRRQRRGRRQLGVIASLIETAKLNGVNPHAWLADILTKLVNRWPASRIDDLMPWAYARDTPPAVNV